MKQEKLIEEEFYPSITIARDIYTEKVIERMRFSYEYLEKIGQLADFIASNLFRRGFAHFAVSVFVITHHYTKKFE